MKKWSLILFTLLSQMAIGTFWDLTIIEILDHQYTEDIMLQAFVALAIMAISLILSLTHLGSPFKAYLAATNATNSWLSREIIFALCFFTTVAVFLFYPSSSLAVLGSLFGLLLLIAMSRLYMIRTIPVWNTWHTPGMFFVSTIIMGNIATTYVSQGETQLPLMNILLPIFALSQVVITLLWLIKVKNERLDEHTKIQQGFRILFSMIGGILFILAVDDPPGSQPLTFTGLVLLFAGELLGRYLFYEAQEANRNKAY